MTQAPAKGTHRIRENIDSLAIAVLMAVLMKYFAIEAYQIPTSSMQPTMMGSKAAGVFDRILVDKARYLLHEPARWDIAVFRYPLRKTQNYVKRIAGLPNDELRIAGGNLYRVKDGGDPNDPNALEPLRRPAAVQAGHWKEMHPARSILHGEAQILGSAFTGSGADWSEASDGSLTVRQRSERGLSSLTFLSAKDGGLVDRVYDGYPDWVAKAMIAQGESIGSESVQDVRFGFEVTPGATPTELRVELQVNHPDGGGYTFAMIVSGGEGQLVVEQRGQRAAESAKFPLPLNAGSSTALQFVHLDDEFFVTVDDVEVQRLDCNAFRTLRALYPVALPGDRAPSAAELENSRGGRVVLRLQVRGGETVKLSGLRVDRDLHYLPSSAPGEAGPPTFKVPDGHYFMLGDNTQQSVDSRDWTAITIGRSADGRIVDPTSNPNAQKLRGNLRAIPISDSPDPDENPVIVTDEKKVVFTDELGGVWKLDGEIVIEPSAGRVYTGQTPWFAGTDGAWMPVQDKEHFVPREHIIGRPLLTFFPVWPWFRVGIIR